MLPGIHFALIGFQVEKNPQPIVVLFAKWIVPANDFVMTKKRY